MKSRFIAAILIFSLVSISAMGQGVVRRNTTTQTESKPKPKPQPKPKPSAPKVQPEADGYDVTFSCNVSSAAMYIDGRNYGSPTGSVYLKTGNHSVKLTCIGYDDYNTDITVNKANTSFTFNMKKQPIPEVITAPKGDFTKGDFNLKEYLKAPMGITALSFDKNPTHNEMMKALGKVYKIHNSDNSTYLHTSIYDYENEHLEFPSYHGIPFYYFDALYELDGTRPTIFYKFETRGDKPSITEMYRKLDLIVQDFHAIGIPIDYNKVNDGYTKAEGKIKVNGVYYYLKLYERSSYWQVQIYFNTY